MMIHRNRQIQQSKELFVKFEVLEMMKLKPSAIIQVTNLILFMIFDSEPSLTHSKLSF